MVPGQKSTKLDNAPDVREQLSSRSSAAHCLATPQQPAALSNLLMPSISLSKPCVLHLHGSVQCSSVSLQPLSSSCLAT
eukprot:7915244-Karenia_brevis.AAC.1